MTFLPELAEMVAFWEEANVFRLIESYPYQTHIPDENRLYASWLFFLPKDQDRLKSQNWKWAKLTNGVSPDHAAVRSLQDLLNMIETRYGVVLDHIVVKRSENHILVLWHETGGQFRYSGRVPLAAALVPVQISTTEKGVA